jgi:hypothetical protein
MQTDMSCTQMFALCGNRTRDLLRSSGVINRLMMMNAYDEQKVRRTTNCAMQTFCPPQTRSHKKCKHIAPYCEFVCF